MRILNWYLYAYLICAAAMFAAAVAIVPVAMTAKATAQRAIDAGHGTDGFARLVDVLGKPTPTR